jgi:hypothetical protein
MKTQLHHKPINSSTVIEKKGKKKQIIAETHNTLQVPLFSHQKHISSFISFASAKIQTTNKSNAMYLPNVVHTSHSSK